MSSEISYAAQKIAAMALGACLTLSATPVKAEREREAQASDPFTRSYSIAPHDGRSPSVDYRDEMKAQISDWLADLKNVPWEASFLDLEAERIEEPSAQPSREIRVYGAEIEFFIGLDDEIDADMSVREVQELISYVRIDGLQIAGLETPDWRFQALPAHSRIDQGIRVIQFGSGEITLVIDTDFSAVYGRDRRVVAGVPEDILPEFVYLEERQRFSGKITLHIAFNELPSHRDSDDRSVWRKIGHEAWRRDHAPTIFELMAINAGEHMKSGEGNPVVTFRVNRANFVPPGLEGEHVVSATITVFDMLDDAVKAERWKGLAMLSNGHWFLQEMYLSQKCRRGPDLEVWTSLPCP
ncbi:MAG: hypothetical protein AAF127_15965 [Pseudomonadota bacterium]